MSPFWWVMSWADLVPPLHFTSILEGEFFPKWLTVLHHWLTTTANYAEARMIFKQWVEGKGQELAPIFLARGTTVPAQPLEMYSTFTYSMTRHLLPSRQFLAARLYRGAGPCPAAKPFFRQISSHI
ncbi:unnamed protein product [Discosporangium mesarthrocarpum]